MSDEPVEGDDAGSDAEGASSSSGSDDREGDRDAPEDAPADDSPGDDAPAGNGPDDPSTGDSADASDADASDADAPTADTSDPDAPTDTAPPDDSVVDGDGEAAANENEADGADLTDAEDEAAPDDQPTDGLDGTGFQFVEHARENVTEPVGDTDASAESSGRPGYTDDHVTASDDAPPDAAAESDDEATTADVDDAPEANGAPEATETDPADHAPVGAQAPSPDEGPTTSVTDTAGAGTSTGGGGSGGNSFLSGGIGGTAPPDDEEMPLTEHIEEMLTRLAIVVVVASLATLAAFPFANDVIIHMWYDVHGGSVEACRPAPQSDGCVAPHVYGPLELVLTRIRVAGLVGLLVALPLAVYQIYRFMRPGLYPHERRYYLAAVPFSLVLGIVGMSFAYFVLLPLLFEYFITYTEGSADLAFQLAETMNLVLLMMGMLAIIFQIPLLIMLAIMMGITTRRWLERRRLYFWGLFLGVAVIFGPDPTGMAPFLLTATMVALFEGTLLLLRWTGR